MTPARPRSFVRRVIQIRLVTFRESAAADRPHGHERASSPKRFQRLQLGSRVKAGVALMFHQAIL
jgi:hypothetical protein